MSQLLALTGAVTTGVVIYVSYLVRNPLLLELWFGLLLIGTFVFLYKLWRL